MGQIEKLARQLLELLTEGLGLEPTRFNHYVENERMMSMRFNLYPPCPQPELAIGLRAHTDPHLLTILHQDDIAGLQVHIVDEWITVKPRPDCFVVNVGDLFQVRPKHQSLPVLHQKIPSYRTIAASSWEWKHWGVDANVWFALLCLGW